MRKFLVWFKANWLLILVVVIGGILRFYRLRDLTTFGGDQGIDYQNVARMLVDKKLTLLGPTTHVGIFLGPLYYYLLIPFFLIFKFYPIAAPVMFALFGTATVGLVYILAKKLFFIIHHPSSINHHRVFAFLTALLYAVSPVILESSRAPSQPHLIPFFATLLLISIIRIIEKHDRWWDWMVIGISLGSIIQFHFLTFPLYIFFAVIMMILFIARKHERKKLSLFLVSCFLFLVVLIFPWFFFELRHNFFITNQIFAYLKTGEVSFFPVGYLERALDLIWFSFDRLIGQGSQFVTVAAIVLSVAGLISAFFKETPRIARNLLIMFAFYFLINVFGISFYYSPLSNHYISALYPVIILLTSLGIYRIFPRLLGFIVFIMFIIFIFSRNDLSRNHGYTMPDGLTASVIQRGSLLVAQNVTTKKFQIASILDGDTRAGPYRYVLEFVYRKVPMKVEEYPDAEELFVIARRNPLNVLNNTVWEISSFQPEKIANSWDIGDNIMLYQLEKEKQ